MRQKAPADPVAGFFLIVAFFSMFGLAVGGFMLRDAARDRSTASEIPRAITLAELLTHGPGDNSHVRVSRFNIEPEYVVSTNGSDRLTFLIFRPKDPVPGKAQQLLLVENRYLKNAAEVKAFSNNPLITGIYSTGTNSTSRKTRQLLEAKYSKIDFWNAPYLEIREFRGDWYFQRALLVLKISGGVFAGSVLTAILFIWLGKQNKRLEKEAWRKLVSPEVGSH